MDHLCCGILRVVKTLQSNEVLERGTRQQISHGGSRKHDKADVGNKAKRRKCVLTDEDAAELIASYNFCRERVAQQTKIKIIFHALLAPPMHWNFTLSDPLNLPLSLGNRKSFSYFGSEVDFRRFLAEQYGDFVICDSLETFSDVCDLVAATRNLYLHGPENHFLDYLQFLDCEFSGEMTVPAICPGSPSHPLSDFYASKFAREEFEEKVLNILY